MLKEKWVKIKKAIQTKTRPHRRFSTSFFLLTFLLGFFLIIPSVWSLRYQLDNSTILDIDTTLTYGIAMRMEEADKENLADINADDGNRAFDQYDLTSNRITVRTEMNLHRDNVGIFARGRAYYDDVYHHSNSNDSPETQNNFVGGILSDHQKFTDDIKDEHGRDIELMDLYAYGDFYIGDRPLSVRLGQQVISWGESLFTLGGVSSAQSYADANMLNVPGAELEDIFLPTEQIVTRFNFFQNLSISGYYQWEWEKHRSPAAGSYLSYMDFADEGGYHLLAVPGLPATANRISDNPAKDRNQWGIGLNYLATNLNDTEFGVYYINYHEKFPLAKTKIGAGTPTTDWTQILGPELGAQLNFFDNLGYYLDYQEDISLYGASFSTQVGPTNISGEISYRKDYLVPVNNPLEPLGYSYEPFDVVQLLASAIHFFGPVSFIDSTTLMFEIGVNHVLDDENLYKDATAWGSTTSLAPTFFQILPNLDMTIPISFKHRPSGSSSLPGTFTEGQHQLSVGTDFLYAQKYQFGLKYTSFLGDSDKDPLSDRDYLSFNFKYTF